MIFNIAWNLQRNLQIVIPRLVLIGVLGVTVYWLVPRFTVHELETLPRDAKEQVEHFIKGVRQTANDNNNSAQASRQTRCVSCTDPVEQVVQVTPLVNVLVKVPVVISADQRMTVSAPEYRLMLRPDNLVLTLFVFVGLMLGFGAARGASRGADYLYPRVQSQVEAVPAAPKTPAKLTAGDFLESDVERAEERARDVYRRSTILLGGGIVMAFVGVTIFYVTLPTSAVSSQLELERERFYRYQLESKLNDLSRYQKEQDEQRLPSSSRAPKPDYRGAGPDDFLSPAPPEQHPWLVFASHSLRPTGMLVFMEGIAWFLLRQYRVLIEEYKSFLRVYLRRSSYLIAWKAAEPAGAEQQFSIARAMLGDDISDTLKKDETTQALEVMKISEPPPIIEFLREVKELVPKLDRKTTSTG